MGSAVRQTDFAAGTALGNQKEQITNLAHGFLLESQVKIDNFSEKS